MLGPGQVEHDGHVDHEEADSQHRLPADHLKDLERDAEAAGDHGQVLCPAPAPGQADRFGQLEQGKRHQPDRDHDHRPAAERPDPGQDVEEDLAEETLAPGQLRGSLDVQGGCPLPDQPQDLLTVRKQGNAEQQEKPAPNSALEDDQSHNGVDRLRLPAQLGP